MNRCGPNLAPGVPVFIGTLTVAADATGQATRLTVPLPWGEFTEAFLVTLHVRRTATGEVPALAAFLIGSDTDAESAALQLPACEMIGAGCTIHQALPGWFKDAVIDVIGLDMDDLTTRRAVTINVVVKRLERTVRTEEHR